MSHTYAELPVSKSTYHEIRQRLIQAGYDHAFMDDGAIDMQGIGLKTKDATGTEIVMASILSARTKTGLVELVVNGEKIQMDLDKAREVSRMLTECIEAAVSDQLFHAFLTSKTGMTDEQAGAALLDFRELRQGSRDVVIPN